MVADVLVTGGSSPLGEHVVRRLVRDGRHVLTVVRSDEAATRVVAAGAEVVWFDLSDERPPLVAAPILVHLAGTAWADAAIRLRECAGAQRMIAISSASATVSGHPRQRAVVAAEQSLLAGAGATWILRPTMIYGSARDRNVRLLWRALQRLPFVPRFRGGAAFQPVYVDDVAAAVAELVDDLHLHDHVLPVGGPEAVCFDDLVAALSNACDWHRHGPRVPVSLLARGANVVPLRASPSLHAIAMLSVDRSVPPPPAVGLSYPPMPLFAGIATAVQRYSGAT
jgi:uncharacterized protein YbjT (DUF2867 family)